MTIAQMSLRVMCANKETNMKTVKYFCFVKMKGKCEGVPIHPISYFKTIPEICLCKNKGKCISGI